MSQVPPPPPDDATGDDAYTRRMQMSQPPPPPPPAFSATITRAPVRYSLPPAPEELPPSEAEVQALDEPKSSRPGQAGFAQRLLSKYGWTKGSGLGARGTGIINPLYTKADKRKKKSDAEGGGFTTPATTGKILGGSKSKTAQEEEAGKFGNMSEVIRLENMLDGMDLDEELTRGEGGIMQEIGEECGDKYGSVERVYIHRGDSPLVFVHFVSPLSALRAVNALEGRVFGGNAIAAKFWPKEQFEAGEYE
jgi:splicing factor 45